MSDLFIIEAPGKRKTLEALLESMGRPGRVIATKGHLCELPHSLRVPTVDADFREVDRCARDDGRIQNLVTAASSASKVIIATDADSEGDVIAWDIAEAISHVCPAPLRMRLRGLDEESVRSALADAEPARKEDAIPGRTRAIIDRLIGQVFSSEGVAVGRVSTAILGMIAIYEPSPYRLFLVAPDKNGGRPWRAYTDIRDPISVEVAKKLASIDFPPISLEARISRNRSADNLGDVLVKAGDELDMSPKQADRCMQSLYEAGSMSYPRAGSRGVSPMVSQYLTMMAEKQGVRTSGYGVSEKATDDVHDAPHPLVSVDARRDPIKLGADEAISTLITRGLFSTISASQREVAGASAISSFLLQLGFSAEVAQLVASLEWTREVGPRYPGQKSWVESELVKRRADTAILEKIVSIGLGRPSTWANHVETFLSRGLVDDELKLTEKGVVWMRSSPRELLNPSTSIAIERACEAMVGHQASSFPFGREPWEQLAAEIVSSLPPSLSAPIASFIEAHRALKIDKPSTPVKIGSIAAIKNV